jgi:hypothetical protein
MLFVKFYIKIKCHILEHVENINFNIKYKKKCVACPQEDFLFKIHHKWSKRTTRQNHEKVIETPNLPIKTKIFPKKVCLVPEECKRA